MINIEPLKELSEMEKIWATAVKGDKYYLWDVDEGGGYYTKHIFLNRGESELSCETLKKIFKSDDPKMEFYSQINECAMDQYVYYGEADEIESRLKEDLSDEDREITEECYDAEFAEWVSEHIAYTYDANEFLSEEYKVNIVVDTGNANYDFACDSILNWYGSMNDKCKIHENSSIKWLCKQQKKWAETQKEIKYVWKHGERRSKDKFVDSVITELENLPQYCGMLTFLVTMTLGELLELKEKMNSKIDKNLTISKDTMCGLFESWNGSGSVLEIELERDVVVPVNMIWDAWIDGTKPHGYDVDEVYGLIGSCWNGKVKVA